MKPLLLFLFFLVTSFASFVFCFLGQYCFFSLMGRFLQKKKKTLAPHSFSFLSCEHRHRRRLCLSPPHPNGLFASFPSTFPGVDSPCCSSGVAGSCFSNGALELRSGRAKELELVSVMGVGGAVAPPLRARVWAVGSSHETSAASTSLPSAWNATWPQQYSTSDTTVMLPNKTKVTTTPMRCEVCKIDCNSKDVYEKHILGKKHKRNSQVGLVSGNGIGPCITGFKRHGIGFQKKAPNKIKVAQSAWCEVCKINCNSRDMYIAHLAGKKHLKNMEKLSKPKIHEVISATTAEELSKPKIHEVIGATTAEELSKPKIHEVISATTGNAPQHAAIPMIGPQEKPDANKPKPMKAPKKTKPKKALEMDIEAKKRKVVEGGAAEGDVRLCSLCNVVCNSQTVFNDHLTGHKHAAMVKKAGSSAG